MHALYALESKNANNQWAIFLRFCDSRWVYTRWGHENDKILHQDQNKVKRNPNQDAGPYKAGVTTHKIQ